MTADKMKERIYGAIKLTSSRMIIVVSKAYKLFHRFDHVPVKKTQVNGFCQRIKHKYSKNDQRWDKKYISQQRVFLFFFQNQMPPI